MGQRNATFVDCDRCGAQSEHKSPEEAAKYTMQLQVTGAKQAYAPHHMDDERSFLCSKCAMEFRDWWREPANERNVTDKADGDQ